jgi:hypothetical protein
MKGTGAVPSMLRGRFGQYNQAGDLSPRTGPYSEEIEANLGSLFVAPDTVFMRKGFNNFVGGIQITNANPRAVVNPSGYTGAAPAGLQPSVVRPLPWSPLTPPTLI